MILWHYELNTPMGPMRATFDGRGRLLELVLEGFDPRKTSPLPPKEQREAKRFLDRQIDAYLAGTLRTFTVPLDPQGRPSHLRIWDTTTVSSCRLCNSFTTAHRVILPGEGPLPKALRDLESGLGWRKPGA